MAQNVEPLAASLGDDGDRRRSGRDPRGLRGRPQVAQPVAARVAQVPQAPPGADRAGDGRVPDRRRRPGPRAAPVQLHRHPQARPDRRRRAPAVTPAPDGRDRRPPARRADAGRQRLPDVAADRVLEHGHRGRHRHVRRRDRRVRGQHHRQPADARRRRHAQPADPVRDPRGRQVPGQRDGLDGDRDLRAVLVDGREPARAQPVPVDPRAGVRRGGARPSASATGGSSSGTSCPTPSARSWSSRRCSWPGTSSRRRS